MKIGNQGVQKWYKNYDKINKYMIKTKGVSALNPHP